jgi:hypothetical protein
MKQSALVALALSAVALAACEARVDSNGVSVNRTDIRVENTLDALGNTVERAGERVENGVDSALNEVREGGRDVAREADQAGERTERAVEGNRTGR